MLLIPAHHAQIVLHKFTYSTWLLIYEYISSLLASSSTVKNVFLELSPENEAAVVSELTITVEW